MKFFTSTLLVNRLLTSVLTSVSLFFAGNVIALTPDQSILNIGVPETKQTTIATGIEYASLTASATEKAVFINWVTASEQNNSHFEVERSLDMKTFKTVAMVLDGFAATGTTGKTYKFKEDAGAVRNGKTVYYRLKQIDTDNKVHYSTVMAVQMNTTVTVFPKDEVLNTTSIKLISTKNVAASMVENQNGQTLLSKQSINTGISNISAAQLN